MKKITHYITLRFISITLLILILVMASVQIASMLKIKSDVANIQTLWDEVKVEQSEKLRLENSIRTSLGFNGMIHKLKSSILNHDTSQLESIKTDIQSVETIIQLYHSFQLTPAEDYALNDISDVLIEYQINTQKLATLLDQQIAPNKINQLIHVDAKPALQGLEILRQYNRKQPKIGQANTLVPADKFMLLTDLLAQIGYGGLVHNLKNFQITANANYVLASMQNITQLRLLIQQYSTIPLTVAEQKALQDLIETTELYEKMLQDLQRPIDQQTESLWSIMLDVDRNATTALEVLHEHIEIELKDNLYSVGENIHSIQDSINNLIKVIIFISLCALLFFAYIMFVKVINPLQDVTEAMVTLARQRHSKDANFTANQVFEIRQMVRSIRIFKKNEDKRRNTAKSLNQLNETTLHQLSEITKLQDKSEQKTEQALTLANHLIELQKSADEARNNALDNQRRVNMILNTVHDAIITSNSKGIIESINTTTELMLGYHESELLGKSISTLMPTKMATQHKKILHDLHTDNPPELPKVSREQVIKRADGSTFPVEVFMGQSEFNNEITYTAVIRDITRRRKTEEEIQKLVLTDPLTNLANRRHFNQDLQRSMDNTKRLNLSVGLLMIDLDNFKPVNDTYGHNVGDKVLQLVSKRLKDVTRNVDLIARLGGDEFAVILNSLSDCFDPLTPAQKVIDSIAQPMDIDGEIINIGATIGISISDKNVTVMEEFIDYADKALYKAKSLGKGQYFSYQDLAADER